VPYIYSAVSSLNGKAKVGTTQCVALVQHFGGVPHTSRWREGQKVLANHSIRPGTAIATFVKGRYPNTRTGNHAALFLRHAPNGFWVIDQWKDDRPEPLNRKPKISARLVLSRGKKQNADGSWPSASDNADAFSTIE
jgi:hypothetical protein